MEDVGNTKVEPVPAELESHEADNITAQDPAQECSNTGLDPDVKPVAIAKDVASPMTFVYGKVPQYVTAKSREAGLRWIYTSIHKCKICPEDQSEPMEKDDFCAHLADVHDMGISGYESKYGKETYDKESHDCRICHQLVLREPQAMVKHLAQHYPRKKRTIGHMIPIYHSQYIAPPPPKNESKKNSISRAEVIDSVSKCIYTCKICDWFKPSYSRNDFREHLMETHHMNLKAYNERFKTTATVERFVNCKLCGKDVIKDWFYIDIHLKVEHEIKGERYPVWLEKQLGGVLEKNEPDKELNVMIAQWKKDSKTRPEFEPEESKRRSNRFMPGKEEVPPEVGNHFLAQEPNVVEEIVSYTKKNKPAVPVFENDTIKYETEVKRILFNYWANAHEVQCKICDESFFGVKYNFRWHLSSKHNVKVTDYEAQFGIVTAINRSKPCLICQQEIPMHQAKWATHLKTVHKVPTLKYFQDYLEPSLGEEGVAALEKRAQDLEALGGLRPLHYIKMRKEAHEWANQCVYECKLCSEFPSNSCRKAFRLHLTSAHDDMSLARYQELFGSVEASYVPFSCLICDKSLILDADIIKAHASSVHSLKFPDFYEKFIKGKDIENADPVLNEIEHNPGLPSVGPSVDLPEPYKGKDQKLQEKAVDWCSKCVYACRLCLDFGPSHSRSDFVDHLKKKHNSNEKIYIEHFGSLEETASFKDFHCELCTTVLIMSHDLVSCHLQEEHDLTVTEYYVEHVNDTEEADSPEDPEDRLQKELNRCNAYIKRPKVKATVYSKVRALDWSQKCTYSCKICKNGAPFKGDYPRFAFIEHLRVEHSIDPSKYAKVFGSLYAKKTTVDCEICWSTVLCDSVVFGNHLDRYHGLDLMSYFLQYVDGSGDKAAREDLTYRDMDEEDEVAKNWATQCLYDCKMCNKTVDFGLTRFELFNHLWHDHLTTVEEYEDMHGNSEVVSRRMDCSLRVCKKARLLWDYCVLTSHAVKVHKMPLTKYHKLSTLLSKSTVKSDKDLKMKAATWANQCFYDCRVCSQFKAFIFKGSVFGSYPRSPRDDRRRIQRHQWPT